MARRNPNEDTTPPAPSVEPSAPIPLMTGTTKNQCPRCLRGAIIGMRGEESCLACGYVPITPSEYASAEAWMSSLKRDKDGSPVMPRDHGVPSERLWVE